MTLLDFNSIEEEGIYTDLLREFSHNGHDLYIISPTEKRKKNSTKIIKDKNTTILKLQIGNMQKTNVIEKGISTLTLESRYKIGIKKYFSNIKFDLILYSTPPITLQRAVEYVKKRDNAKSYLLLKDIFPQNAVDIGLLKTSGIRGILLKYFQRKEKKLYAQSDYIGCMSEANVQYILKHHAEIQPQKIEICPNSIEPKEISISNDEKRKIRREYNIPLDKKVFIYGGNLGKPQGIDFLIETIELNESKSKSFFLIVGSGTEFLKLQAYFEKEKPQNAKLFGHLPKKDYELLANSCDVGLIYLDNRFTIPNFPSRLLSYMQAGMPVLAATDVNTDIGKVIEEGKLGYWCRSGDAEKFSDLVNSLCDEKKQQTLGNNSRRYLENNYNVRQSYEIIMNHFR